MTVVFSLHVVVVVVVLLPSLAIGQVQQQPLSSRVEWDALFSLRSSLGLRSRDWPRKVDPCSAWAGIRCGIDGRVVGINLSGLRRTRLGRINPQFSVDALSNLTLLESFNSTAFYLRGPIPDWFGAAALPSLTVLDLRSSSVFGAVPPSLGSLTNLTHLDLSQNSLTGVLPESLFDLSRLEVLDLSRNSLTGFIPQSLSSIQPLRVLNLSSNFLSGPFPSTFGSLSNLTLLDLGNNSLEGPLLGNVFFNNLSQLQSLVLSHNSFSGALSEGLWDLPKLRYLDLSYNNFTGDLVEEGGGIAGSIFNLSHNELYGGLNLSKIDRFGFIDLADNYFQGKVIVGAGATIQNASFVGNCLQNVSNQRSIQDCKSFYAARGLSFGDGSGTAPVTAPQPSPVQKKSNRHLKFILAGVFGGLGFIVLLVVVFILCQCRRKEGSTNQREVGVDAVSSGVGPQPSGVSINFSNLGDAFTYEQLLRATASFGDLNLIKLGHSGSLYRGLLEGGVPIVVKKIDPSTGKRDAHMVELDVFSRVSHTRLIPFLGHCLDQENEKFLVYKYMPNGDLSNALIRKTSQEEEGLQSLDWITRSKIAIGIAEALSYLHHECTPPLVHRDIQASSILLDDKFEVRLGSLSEVCAQEGDTHQNVITRFLRLSQTTEHGSSGAGTSSSATCAYDVYCLGKVLLELVTGKLGISGSNDSSTSEWLDYALPFINVYEKELVTKILDPSLIVYEDLLEEVWAMAIVAKSCLNPKPSKRPLTRYILKALENPLKVVREENTSGSARLRATSSRGSWNAALFGSWRHSSDIAPSASTNTNTTTNNNTNMEREGISRKHSLTERGGLQGSGRIGCAEVSSSCRRPSKEIFPEPPFVASPHQVSRPQEDEEEEDRR